MKNFKLALTICVLLSSTIWTYPVISSCGKVKYTGIYTIQFEGWSLDVECDMDTDGGGWMTLLTRRGGYHDFYETWEVYSDEGIGSPKTQYILPLKFIHKVLAGEKYELLIEMTEGKEYAWALYNQVGLGSEQDKFPLTYGAYDDASTGGDSFVASGTKFTTKDNDNDSASQNCATLYRSAGWFAKCFHANPFGNYEDDSYAKGIVQNSWKGYYVSLDTLSWKVRPSVCSYGFGSTCSRCEAGFHIATIPLFQRRTCLHDCEIQGCKECRSAFYEECIRCRSEFNLKRDGTCQKSGEPDANNPDDPDPSTPEGPSTVNCSGTITINHPTAVNISIGK